MESASLQYSTRAGPDDGLAVRLDRMPRRCRWSTRPENFAGRAPCIARQVAWLVDELAQPNPTQPNLT